MTLTTKDLSAGDDEDEEKGPNGLPAIFAHLLINGHGHTIQRDPDLFSPAHGGDGADPCSGRRGEVPDLTGRLPGGKPDDE